mgnify:CR=1 FL=1
MEHECKCEKRKEYEKELKKLEQQFEQAKAQVAYIQGSIATYTKVMECDCGDDCEATCN